MTYRKYKPYRPVQLPDRTWPDRILERAPRFCSVDLRDGNQALVEPMNPARKRRMYDKLVEVGFKEIEVGFPAASKADLDFITMLVDEDLIPDDVTIQVLTQARPEIIDATFDALVGVRRAVIHLYNSTSEVQRRVVFQKGREEIIELATDAARQIKARSETCDTEIGFQYSPESFSGTELDFALQISEAVMDVWQPTAQRPMVLNLPATVEMSTPNVYADQIEWFCRNLKNRASAIISVHTHNDRGCAVAAAELGLMAGAQRVEGTLFGNGERTGNVDVVTLALNLYSQGVDPGLDLGDIHQLVELVEHCNRMPVHPRHPYAGDLVYTAFSGSHQDAIKKGLEARAAGSLEPWQVPYLPMDPADLGCSYEAVIRINSQSGKGGLGYLLHSEHQISPPRELLIEFGAVIQALSERQDGEVTPGTVWNAFQERYLTAEHRVRIIDFHPSGSNGRTGPWRGRFVLEVDGVGCEVNGHGNGPVAAFVAALSDRLGMPLELDVFHQHAQGSGAGARAMAYIRLGFGGEQRFGVCGDDNIVRASLGAVAAAASRLMASAAAGPQAFDGDAHGVAMQPAP